MPDAEAILKRLEGSGMRLGLDQVRALLAELGNPQDAVPAVLVAGTNGKGSTAAHLAAILSAAGLTSGLYTSPHLEKVEERIRIDGLAIDADDLARLLQQAVDAAAATGLPPPTYFEAITVAAMLRFSEVDADVAVLEVGLGGRLDATNVVNPALSVITEIGLDHQQFLGETLSEIAVEKAGILRVGVPCCYWISDPVARREVERVGAELGASMLDVRRRTPELAAQPLDGEITIRGLEIEVPVPSRAGGWTLARNLNLALTAAEVLAAGGRLDFDLTQANVERALRSCRWPGRWEWVERPDGGQVLLDGAHNPQGVAALIDLLDDRTYGLLFGALADKPLDRMLPPLAAGAEWLALTRPDSDRAADPASLAASVPGEATVIAEPAAALDAALERVTPDELLVVCGSLYLVGEVRGLLRRWWGRPEGMGRIYGPFDER